MAEEQETKPAGGETVVEQDTSKAEEEANGSEEQEMGESNRAVILTNFGHSKNVVVAPNESKSITVEKPKASEAEVLIKVQACGVSFQDVMHRQGFIEPKPTCPFTMGSECAGEVVEVGTGVQNFKVGDRVVALPYIGAWADYVAVNQKFVFKIPDNLSFLDAVAITMHHIMAYILLFEMGTLSPGQTILINSAGGAVAQAVAQLCRTVQDVLLIGVATKTKHEKFKAGCMDHLFDYSNYVSEVKKVCPEGVDLVLDGLGEDFTHKGYTLLKHNGRQLNYGSAGCVKGDSKSIFYSTKSWWPSGGEKFNVRKLYDDNKMVGGLNLRSLLHQHDMVAYVSNIYDKVIDLWKKDVVKPIVEKVYALEDAADAMLRLQCRLNVGKILLDLNQKPKLDPVPKKAKVTSILSTKKIPPPPEEEPPTPCDSPSTADVGDKEKDDVKKDES